MGFAAQGGRKERSLLYAAERSTYILGTTMEGSVRVKMGVSISRLRKRHPQGPPEEPLHQARATQTMGNHVLARPCPCSSVSRELLVPDRRCSSRVEAKGRGSGSAARLVLEQARQAHHQAPRAKTSSRRSAILLQGKAVATRQKIPDQCRGQHARDGSRVEVARRQIDSEEGEKEIQLCARLELMRGGGMANCPEQLEPPGLSVVLQAANLQCSDRLPAGGHHH
ncbi:hypothetical protein V8C26DRAFT_108809 [Trichoderma gracile]